MNEFIKWYAQADKETISLMKRFIAKAFSRPNANAYIKQVLKRELDEVTVIEMLPNETEL